MLHTWERKFISKMRMIPLRLSESSFLWFNSSSSLTRGPRLWLHHFHQKHHCDVWHGPAGGCVCYEMWQRSDLPSSFQRLGTTTTLVPDAFSPAMIWEWLKAWLSQLACFFFFSCSHTFHIFFPLFQNPSLSHKHHFCNSMSCYWNLICDVIFLLGVRFVLGLYCTSPPVRLLKKDGKLSE